MEWKTTPTDEQMDALVRITRRLYALNNRVEYLSLPGVESSPEEIRDLLSSLIETKNELYGMMEAINGVRPTDEDISSIPLGSTLPPPSRERR